MRVPRFILALFTLCMVCISSVENANAYFTTYVTARGGYSVLWGHHETIQESFNDWSKYVTVKSNEGSIPVYVRVKAFAGSTYMLYFEGNDWTLKPEDGYYYYNFALAGGETTTALRIAIENIPANPSNEQSFNVVVVYETTPVQFDADGTMILPTNADWSEEETNGKD